MSTLKARLSEDMKNAMRAKETDKLGAIRMLQAAIKQREVDERIELTDADIITLAEKAIKQRKESIAAFAQAGRDDAVAKEQFEIDVISSYLPAQASAQEIEAIISAAIASTGAASVKDMGKVMAQVKTQLAGRADMGAVGGAIKKALGG